MTKIKLRAKDLANLSSLDLAAIAKRLGDVAEAQRFRTLESYLETAHEKQIGFHKAEKRIRFFCGGNRSGKTTAGTIEALWRLIGGHPFARIKTPSKGVLIAQDFETHVKTVLEPKFTQWAPAGAITKIERNQTGAMRKIAFAGGSIMDVMSHDQDIKVFEGSDYDFAWFDEPPPKDIFNAVWRGLTDRGGVCWVTGTPITGPWMYQEVLKSIAGDPLRWHSFIPTEDNARNIGEGDVGLGLKRIEEFASMLDPDERAARLRGEFLQLQGLIFKEWSRKSHLIRPFPWPSHWPIWESVDPHPSKPWAVSWTGFAPDQTQILLRSGLYAGVLEEVAEQVLRERQEIAIEHELPIRIQRCLIDNAASVPLMTRSHTDPTARRRSVREEFEALVGPMAGGPRVTVAPKNVKSKIDLFKSLLHISEDETGEKKSSFYAFDIPENERFFYEIENYVWDTRRGGVYQGTKDTPRKIDDDILDAVMQVVLTAPRQNEGYCGPIRTANTRSYRV